MEEIARQCVAHNRQGERCRRSAMLGQQICAMHGGKAPDALRVAKHRLLALVEPALDGLLLALESKDLPAIIAAARIVLDRAGFGPQATLHIEEEPKPPSWAQWLTHDEMEQVRGFIALAKQRMESGVLPTPDETLVVIEAQAELVVEDASGLSPWGKSRTDDNELIDNRLQETAATEGADVDA